MNIAVLESQRLVWDLQHDIRRFSFGSARLNALRPLVTCFIDVVVVATPQSVLRGKFHGEWISIN